MRSPKGAPVVDPAPDRLPLPFRALLAVVSLVAAAVAEAVSVMLQVYSFRVHKKRIFKMAPLHHHFELKGLVETKIIVRFWIISLLLAILSLSTLKLR